MLPRFSKVKQRKESADTDLLKMSWGTFLFKITMSKKSLQNDFDNTLYPHQRIYNLVAIIVMVSVHLLVGYFLLYKSDAQLEKPVEEKKHLVFLSLQAGNEPKNEQESAPLPVQPKKQQKSTRKRAAISPSKGTSGKLPNKAPASILSQIAAAQEKRELQQKTLEAEAIQQNKEAQLSDQPRNQPPSENDIALARIKANIQAANYNRKGHNGIFQVLHKGVQTGRFSFRGWTNDVRESNWQTYEVDAGVGGNVELALVRRMIQIIREHYSGDFNWDSQRMGRVVVLSARPVDNAKLEKFLMREFFESK